MVTKFKVVNGPSKWDLMLAFFDPEPHGEARTVKFTVQGEKLTVAKSSSPFPSYVRETREIEITLLSVERDRDTGNFSIEGEYSALCLLARMSVKNYSTETRKGFLSTNYILFESDVQSEQDATEDVVVKIRKCRFCAKPESRSPRFYGEICEDCFESQENLY